ncbi:hypothetical protein QFZ33_002273 [Arthrobacter globiformis]|nr:transposase [Arthrobacter globiformis]MDQ0618249.1 hypothetical protein [Arthrobacter globiformis]
MTNPAPALVVSDGQRAALEVLSKSRTASHREVQRAQVLLMAAEGLANESIAKVAGVEANNTAIKNIKRTARGYRNYKSVILLRSAVRTAA